MHKHSVKYLLLFCLTILGLSVEKAVAQCKAVFTTNATSGCEPLTIQFNSTSTGAVQNTIWNFGDGSVTSSAQNPNHTFTAGIIGDTTYLVSLTTNCIGGGSSTATLNIKVSKKPSVDFLASKTSVCAITDSVCFTNNSSTGVGYTYEWYFSDSYASTLLNPCHTYSTGGNYDIQLKVTNATGCVNSVTKPAYITVIAAPNSNFSVSPLLACGPKTITISDSSVATSGQISSFLWTFGDGSANSTSANPGSHHYSKPGTYFITLQTKNSLGCSNTTKEAIVIRTLPNASFTATTTSCLNGTIDAQTLGKYINSAAAQYKWTQIGAGTILPNDTSSTQVQLNWSSAGLKTFYLTVSDSACVDSTSKKVTIFPKLPSLLKAIPSDTICSGESLLIQALPKNYLNYNFIVNGASKQNSLSSTYSSSTFQDQDKVNMIVTDFHGCSDSSGTMTVTVNQSPGATLTPVSSTTFCSGKSVTFSASPAGLKSYSFYNGSKLLQSGASTSFTINNVTVPTTITLKDSNSSCSSSADNFIELDPITHLTKPVVNCGITTKSTIDFAWDSVPGATSYQVSVNNGPFITPSSGATGLTHLVSGLLPNDSARIIVRAIGGSPCLDTTYSNSQKCFSNNCTPLSFDNKANFSACTGTTLEMPIQNISSAHYSVSWNGGSYGNSHIATLLVTKDTLINFSILDSTQLACGSYIGTFNVHALPTPVVTLTANLNVTDSVCQNELVVFTASPNSLTNYNFYDGANLLQNGPSNVYSTRALSGTNAITVVGYGGTCPDTSNNSIPLHLNTASVAQATQITCGATTNNSVTFNWDAQNGALGYKISINGGNFITPSSGNNGTSHLVTGLTANQEVTGMVETIFGGTCGYTPISVPIGCYTESCPNIDFGGNFNAGSICQGDSITLFINKISIKNYQVTWPGQTPSVATSFTFAPMQDTIVLVSVQSQGASDCLPTSKYFVVHVNQRPQLKLTTSIPGDSICQGSSITFTATPAGLDEYKFYDNYALVQNTNSPYYSTSDVRNNHLISVVSKEGGCTDSTNLTFNKQQTTVINPLNTPQVNCGTITADTLQFTWNQVPGATGYLISINNGPFVAPTTGSNGLSSLYTGLSLGTVKSAQVIATAGRPCGDSYKSSIRTCQTLTDTSSSGGGGGGGGSNGGGKNKRCLDFSYTLSPSSASNVCFGDSVTLSVSQITALKPVISWNNGLGGTDTVYKVKVIQDSLILFTIRDTSQSLACPTKVNSFTLRSIPLPKVSLLTNARGDSLCSNTDLVLVASPASYDDYKFYNNGVLFHDSAYPVTYLPSLLPGNSLKVIAINQGCIDSSATHNIVLLPLPTVSLTSTLTNDSICFADTIVLNAIPNNLTRYQFYDNYPVRHLLQDSSISTLKYPFLPSGNSNVITVVASNNRCSSLASNVIQPTVIPQPTISLISSAIGGHLCSGSPITFSATPTTYPGYIFINGKTTLQNSASPTFTTTTLKNGDTITVKAVSQYGCRSIQTGIVGQAVTIDSVPDPKISYQITGSKQGVCVQDQDQVTLTGSVTNSLYPNCTYQWGDGGTTTSEQFTPQHTTQYYFTATYKNCPAKDSITIKVDSLTKPVPVVNNGTHFAKICIRDSFLLQATGGLSYAWSPVMGLSTPNAANTYAKPDTNTIYNVTVTNLYCSTTLSSEQFNLDIDLCLTDLPKPIPTLITPNGDGLNDTWKLDDLYYFTKNSLKIFNRWGEQVFSESPYKNDWAGTSTAGDKLPDGIYYFILDLGNGKKSKSGYIVINR